MFLAGLCLFPSFISLIYSTNEYQSCYDQCYIIKSVMTQPKEMMLIHFSKNLSIISPVVIDTHIIELVQLYKCLCTVKAETQVDAICKKVHQRMYHNLSSFTVDTSFIKYCFIPVLLNLFLRALLSAGTGHFLE